MLALVPYAFFIGLLYEFAKGRGELAKTVSTLVAIVALPVFIFGVWFAFAATSDH
jgi:predicted branched-subunit amino acid permease